MCIAGRQWSILLAAAFLAAAVRPCRADGPTPEYEVKAAFLYNFTRFITWPPDTYSSGDAPFVVGVVGDDPFDGALEQAMAGKSVNNHPIQVRHFDSAANLGDCQMLFVPASEDSELSDIMNAEGKKPVLTVGESDAFCPAGGCLRFYIDNDHVRFEIAPDALDAARLKVSAQLMRLARIYRK